jgi:hypothetical protein
MQQARYTSDEVAARGEAIYAQRIRALVEDAHKGKFVLIDIETGDYEVDADDLAATKRALAKRPEAILYGLRIGSPAAYRLGESIANRFDTAPRLPLQ